MPLRTVLVGVLAALAAVVAFAPGTASAAGAQLSSGDYSGAEGAVHYQLYVPSSYSSAKSVPLVVALHGCTQTADGFRQLTRWDTLAEAKGFIVVFPEQDTGSNSLRCWNFFEDSSMHRGGGDAARIAAVTSLVENNYNVDPARVFVNGLSAGGGMASVMAATYPDYFAAIGIGSGCEYAATATCAGYQSADPTQAGQAAYKEMGARAHPMPFIDFQGDQDTTVPPVNGTQRVQQWLLTNDLADDGTANHSVATKAACDLLGRVGKSHLHGQHLHRQREERVGGQLGHPRHVPRLVGRKRLAALLRRGRARRDRRHVRVLHAPPRPVTDAPGAAGGDPDPDALADSALLTEPDARQ